MLVVLSKFCKISNTGMKILKLRISANDAIIVKNKMIKINLIFILKKPISFMKELNLKPLYFQKGTLKVAPIAYLYFRYINGLKP